MKGVDISSLYMMTIGLIFFLQTVFTQTYYEYEVTYFSGMDVCSGNYSSARSDVSWTDMGNKIGADEGEEPSTVIILNMRRGDSIRKWVLPWKKLEMGGK